jgi:hypothetical protein
MSRTLLVTISIAVLASCSTQTQLTSYTPQPEAHYVVDGLIQVGSTRIHATPGNLSGVELLRLTTGWNKQFEISSNQAADTLAIKIAAALEEFEQSSPGQPTEKALFVAVTDIRMKYDTDVVAMQWIKQTVVSHATVRTGDDVVRGFRSTGEFHKTGSRDSIGDEAIHSLIGETLADAANQALADPDVQ